MMVDDPVADRYAHALFELAHSEGRLDDAWREVKTLGDLLEQHKEFRQFLLNPEVEVTDKLRVCDRMIEGPFVNDLRAFLQMVLSMGRAESLHAIVKAFGILVDAHRRRLRVTVRSVHPLPPSLKNRLKQRLEELEQQQVELTEEIAPELIGGLQILLESRLLDGSLKTRLMELRQRLKSVRVH